MPKADDNGALIAVAEKALDEWGFAGAQVEHASTSENIAFRVDTDAGKTYALRMHRPGYHSLAELISEQQWTAALNQAGIGVPVPQMTRDGRGYVTASMPDSTETRHVGVVEWFEGVELSSILGRECDEHTLVMRFGQIGRIAARIHNQAVNWEIPPNFQRHALDADGLMGDAPFWGPFWDPPELTSAERTYILDTRNKIYRILSDYGKNQGTYSLIHADLHPHNLLVNGDALHVIDFDDSGFGWHQYELAVALLDYRKNPHYEAIRDALVAGYRSERPLDDAAVELLPMFFLIRSMASIGWLHERPEHGRKALSGMIQSVCAQAEELQL